MRKLSECKRKDLYAYCENCKEMFEDDLSIAMNSVRCPDCGRMLRRGIYKDELEMYPSG